MLEPALWLKKNLSRSHPPADQSRSKDQAGIAPQREGQKPSLSAIIHIFLCPAANFRGGRRVRVPPGHLQGDLSFKWEFSLGVMHAPHFSRPFEARSHEFLASWR